MGDLDLTLTRFLNASPARVWQAWTDPAILPRWFGPEGFHCVTKEIDLSPGGCWRFDMIGPDGTVWPNRHHAIRHVPIREIRFVLDDDGAGQSGPFNVVVTMTPEGAGTRLTQTMTFPSAAARQTAVDFGAEALGQTTLAKLAEILEA